MLKACQMHRIRKCFGAFFVCNQSMNKQKNKRCIFMKIYSLARMQIVSYIAEMHTFCVDCLDEGVLGEKLTFRICTVANRTASLSIF